MDDLSMMVLAEKENIEISLNNLKYVMARTDKSIIELAAIGTFLHNVYNGVENILKQIIHARDINIAKSDSWHKDLLNISVYEGIISNSMSDQLYEYLAFRHFFIHAYGFMLEEAHLEDLAKNISDIWPQFFSEISKFINLKT